MDENNFLLNTKKSVIQTEYSTKTQNENKINRAIQNAVKTQKTEYDVLMPTSAQNIQLPCDYIIYKAGTLTKALNGSTGAVDYSDLHADVPINQAIAANTDYCHIYVKPGVYTLYDTVVTGRRSVTIEGSGWGRSVNPSAYPAVQFRPYASLGAKWLFTFGDNTGNSWNCQLKNLTFYGREQTAELGAINWYNQYCGRLENLFISNFYNTATPAVAIELANSGSYNCNFNDLFGIHVWDTRIGIQIDNLSNCNNIYSGRLQNGLQPNAKGIYINGPDTAWVGQIEIIGYDETGAIGLHINTGGIHRFFGTRFEHNTTHVQIDTGSATSYFFGCTFSDFLTNNIIDNGTTKSRFINCFNYMTENRGTSTGTGSQQTIAHGLGVTPNIIFITPTATGATETSVTAAADATNIYLTVTNLKTYQWYAAYL